MKSFVTLTLTYDGVIDDRGIQLDLFAQLETQTKTNKIDKVGFGRLNTNYFKNVYHKSGKTK